MFQRRDDVRFFLKQKQEDANLPVFVCFILIATHRQIQNTLPYFGEGGASQMADGTGSLFQCGLDPCQQFFDIERLVEKILYTKLHGFVVIVLAVLAGQEHEWDLPRGRL